MERIENQMVKYTEPTPVCECMMCSGGIYQYESYYEINGDIVCEEHIKDYLERFKKVAE